MAGLSLRGREYLNRPDFVGCSDPLECLRTSCWGRFTCSWYGRRGGRVWMLQGRCMAVTWPRLDPAIVQQLIGSRLGGDCQAFGSTTVGRQTQANWQSVLLIYDFLNPASWLFNILLLIRQSKEYHISSILRVGAFTPRIFAEARRQDNSFANWLIMELLWLISPWSRQLEPVESDPVWLCYMGGSRSNLPLATLPRGLIAEWLWL